MAPSTASELLRRTLEVVQQGDEALFGALDELPAAIYVTNAEGVVTYFNPACIDFTGRTPECGEDRWCVTWRLYTEGGEFLPHDQCPMAVAIREKRSIRGVAAVAERPDGTRVHFAPYPTPILGEGGELLGAVNLLIDITDLRQVDFLQAQARRCQRLAGSVNDENVAETLELMASEYEAKARAIEAKLAPA